MVGSILLLYLTFWTNHGVTRRAISLDNQQMQIGHHANKSAEKSANLNTYLETGLGQRQTGHNSVFFCASVCEKHLDA